jgi:fermentation-respiration switch protein FrsA (DUF1100 family)
VAGGTGDLELAILGVASHPRGDRSLDLSINTSRGEVLGILHPCEGRSGAAVFVGGALGGLDGPADAIYARLGTALASDLETGLTGLRLHYRHPGEFEECVLDVLAGVSFIKAIGALRIALVGHSFGGAVVIKAGELSDLVSGVAALSPQLYGTRTVDRLAPRSLLLVHGTDDTILDAEASRDIYSRALEPKQMVLYEGAGHGLTQCRDELADLLTRWLQEALDG